MKRFFKLCTTFILLVALILPFSTIVFATEVSGTCGDNLQWVLNKSTGELTISGTGEMNDFKNNSNLTQQPWYSYKSYIINVTIDDGVTNIGNYAFVGCDGLTSIILPETITKIGNNAFQDCTKLKSISLPSGIKSLGTYCFDGCYDLYSIVIPSGVSSVPSYCFNDCIGLNAVVIPDSVTSIGSYAFDSDMSLKRLVIPGTSKLTYIGTYAFNFCQFSNIFLPKTLKTVSTYAFYSCSCLKTVCYSGTEDDWDNVTVSNENGDLIAATKVYHEHDDTLETYVIDTTNDTYFKECRTLKSLGLAEKCQHTYESEVVKPTCTNQGYTLYTCSKCGNTYKSNYTPITEHTYIDEEIQPTCNSMGYTLHACVCGDLYKDNYIQPTDHASIEWVVDSEPTCITAGQRRAVCMDCGKCIFTEEIPATGHNYAVIITSPTCTNQGYTTYTCSCGYSYIDNYTEAIGHSFTMYISDSNATTESDGTKTAKCNYCDVTDTIVDYGSRLEDNEIEVISKSYNDNGELIISLSNGQEINLGIINESSQNEWSEWMTSKGASLFSNEEQIRYNINTGTIEKQEIPRSSYLLRFLDVLLSLFELIL